MKIQLTGSQKQVLKYAKKKGTLKYHVQELESYRDDYTGIWTCGVRSVDVGGVSYPTSFKQYIIDVVSDVKDWYKDFGLLETIKNMPSLVKLPYIWWVWVVDSSDTIEEKDWRYYVKVNNNMWVSKVDHTCIVYDPKNKPYGMEHGWTYEQIGEILEEWYLEVTGEQIKAKHETNS